MAFAPTYSPTNNLKRIKSSGELLEKIDEMRDIDITSLVGSIDDAPIRKEIAVIMGQAENKAVYLNQQLLNDIDKEFYNNIQLYGFMVNNKIEKNYFPFYDWLKYMKEVEEESNLKLNMKYQNVFDMILDISETDVSLAKGNLAYYLSKLPGKIKNYNTFFPELEKFIKENFTQASFLDMLCGEDTYNVHKGLVGNHVPLSDKSELIYAYAVSIPNSSWAFKNKDFDGGLKISFSTSDYNEIYEEFAKTEVWKRINVSHESRKKFVQEIFNADLKENPFYEEYQPVTGFLGIREIKWDNLKAFVNHLGKDDVELAEFMMDGILNKVFGDKKENFASQALQIINLALEKELQKDLPVAELKEKKMKI